MIHAAHQRKIGLSAFSICMIFFLSDFLVESIFNNALGMQIFIFTSLLAFIHFGLHFFCTFVNDFDLTR